MPIVVDRHEGHRHDVAPDIDQCIPGMVTAVLVATTDGPLLRLEKRRQADAAVIDRHPAIAELDQSLQMAVPADTDPCGDIGKVTLNVGGRPQTGIAMRRLIEQVVIG